MNDRELLELAAKAAGMNHHRYCESWKAMGEFDSVEQGFVGPSWNPLVNSADAFRLMVKLEMQLWRNTGGTVSAMPSGEAIGFWNRLRDELAPDPYASYRRAIVRAAAEIGKAMP